MAVIQQHLVSYKYEVEEKLWRKYNVLQVRQFNKINATDIKLAKQYEKAYSKNPNWRDKEQFFLIISHLQWL